MVLGDASVDRIPWSKDQPNTSEGCTWPKCAPYCVPCAKTNKYWTCMQSYSECQVNSECVLANCYAHPGYCYADAYPQIARCYMGALPPRVKFGNEHFLRLAAAPPVPLPTAVNAEWKAWAWKCAFVPICLFIVLTAISGKVFHILVYGSGTECKFLPRSRHGLLCLSFFLILITLALQAGRFLVSMNDIRVMERQIIRLEDNLLEFKNLTLGLMQAKEVYNQSLNLAAGTCGEHNPMATDLVKMLAETLRREFDEVHLILRVVYGSLDTALTLLQRGKVSVRTFSWKILFYPIIPSFVAALGAGVVLGITFYVWNLASSKQASKFLKWMKYLSPLVFLFMVLSAALAMACFLASALMAGFCLNIDQNLIAGADRVRFSHEVQEDFRVGEILRGMTRYYLEGTYVNPLATVIQNVQAALNTVNHFYQMFQWLVIAASASCHGLQELDPGPLVSSLLKTTEGAWNFVNAENIYPYYHSTVHQLFCENTPKQAMLTCWVTLFAGLIFTPLLAIASTNHLRTFSYYYTRSDGSLSCLAREEVDSLDKDEMGKAGIDIEKRLGRLDTLSQAVVIDEIIESRSPDVKHKLSLLQQHNDLAPTSDDDSSSDGSSNLVPSARGRGKTSG
eukprot:TRINITY_DN9740_c0_g1_i1.p1 TRINITY_DN9740_c0_g1~~TRINITY_DN9740_c0_g1_i1.p1  ORF type:complete len:715 (-),score=113.08 TRINITY_DN9740_c0_g1_i1:84-1949(-)